MNRQELFDIAYKGLRAQGFVRSSYKNGSCLYRGPEGRKCAIGHLIPDDKYDPKFESVGVGNEDAFEQPGDEVRGIISIQILSAIGITPEENTEDARDFFEGLQIAHDGADTPSYMARNLKSFAKEQGLSVPLK